MLEHRLFGIVLDSVEKVAGTSVALQVTVDGPVSTTPAGPVELETVPPAGSPRQASHMSEDGASISRPTHRPKLHPGYTFGSFVVGETNALAHAAALAAADRPGAAYNPLLIYSDVGLGKPHLLTAIGHAFQSRGMLTTYTTAEEFTNQYIGAIREGKTEEFRLRHRTTDALLIDDIQFLAGKEQTQEGFFHTFNALHMSGCQIVITSDRPPAELSLLQDRVKSRLSGGLLVDIQPPDLETRLAILQAKARTYPGTHKINPEALAALAGMVQTSVRELEGGFNRAVAYADLTGCEITPETVRRVLAPLARQARHTPVTERAVLDAVSAHFDVDVRGLAGRRRDARITLVRHIAMYLLREDAHMSLSDIGRVLGGRDHSTVVHGRNRVAALARTDKVLRHDITSLRRSLAAPTAATSS